MAGSGLAGAMQSGKPLYQATPQYPTQTPPMPNVPQQGTPQRVNLPWNTASSINAGDNGVPRRLPIALNGGQQPQPQQPGGQTPQPGGQQIQPAYVGQVPTAPTYTAPNVPGVNPLNIMNLAGGNLGYNAAQSNVNLDPSSFISSVYGALQPQFAQQNHALNEQLANAGIVGGSGIGAQQQLGMQQQAQFQGDIQPILSQLKGYELSQSQGNQLASNTASQFGAGQGLNAAEEQARQYLQAMQGNQQTGLQGGEFNANQANAMGQFNVGNAIRGAMTDTGSFNQLLAQMLGFQNNDWLARLQAETGLNGQAMGGQTNAFQPTFEQPGATPNMGGLAALAPQSNMGGGSPSYSGYLPFSPVGGVASLGGVG